MQGTSHYSPTCRAPLWQQLQTGAHMVQHVLKWQQLTHAVSCLSCTPNLPPCLSPVSGLSQQPSKLPEFITFRLHVRALRQQQEDLLVALPAQVADLYASVKAWGFRLPHNDQVTWAVTQSVQLADDPHSLSSKIPVAFMPCWSAVPSWHSDMMSNR
jgi:hypothetical protein